MMPDCNNLNELDNTALWSKEPPSVSLSGLSRLRRWVFPVVTATVILILIIVLGVSNTKTSNRLSSSEQKVSNLSQSLNASLQRAQETAKDVERLQFAVENQKDQLISVSEALKHASIVDSLVKSVASLKCSLDRIVKNISTEGGCCPVGWQQFESHCYYFSTLSLNWNQSRLACEEKQAHLAMMPGDKEWAFVSGRADEFYWVGLSDWRTGRWEWINRTPYVMQRRRWVPGQPDNWSGRLYLGTEDCAHLQSDGRLNEKHCVIKMKYICQKHII